MANQDARQDRNQHFALLGHSNTSGTAETRKIVATSGGALTMDSVETTGFNGGSVSVGTAEVEITFTGTVQGLMVQADHDNSNTVYIGGTGMDINGALAVSRLEPGDAISMDLNDASAPVYAIGGTTAQKVWKAALT